jgi:hypothetical protein
MTRGSKLNALLRCLIEAHERGHRADEHGDGETPETCLPVEQGRLRRSPLRTTARSLPTRAIACVSPRVAGGGAGKQIDRIDRGCVVEPVMIVVGGRLARCTRCSAFCIAIAAIPAKPVNSASGLSASSKGPNFTASAKKAASRTTRARA